MLLIGGNGFLGPILQRQLLQKDLSLYVTSRRPGPHIASNATYIPADFMESEAMRVDYWHDIMKRHHIDVVINNAALTTGHNADDFNRINWQVPEIIFLAAAQTGVSQIIQVSSLAVTMGDRKRLERSNYPRTKKKAEDILRTVLDSHDSTRYTIVRPACIVSPEPGGIPVLAMATHSDKFVVVGNTEIDPISASDTSNIISACINNTEAFGQVIPAAGPRTTWEILLSNVRREVGLPPGKATHIPCSLAHHALAGAERFSSVRSWLARFLPPDTDMNHATTEALDISMIWRLPISDEERVKMTQITGITPQEVWHQFKGCALSKASRIL